MFLSKIWFFLVTMVAAVAVTIALIMPRPAERAALLQEDSSVRTACLATGVLLRDDARARIQLTSDFAQEVRQRKLSRTLFEASRDEIISGEANAKARKELTSLVKRVSDDKPSFVWLLDRRGRVVARSSLEDTGYGDSVYGYYLVQDALGGYVRDDLWMMEDGLYRVAAAPVLTQGLEWAGAVVVGQSIDKDFAISLGDNISANINFYVGSEAVASNKPVQIHRDVVEGAAELQELDEGRGCSASTILYVEAAGNRYAVVNATLPGEAGEQGAFYSVYIERAKPLNFMGMLKSTKKSDLNLDRFPWFTLIGAFVGMMGIGFFLTIREVDKPLKRLGADAVSLAQGDIERFNEIVHRSKFGSIARSVNIAIDKMHRDAKAAKKDLDQLLGPSQGIDAAASALPPMGFSGMGAPVPTPPPSEFKFGGPLPTPAPDESLSSPGIPEMPDLGLSGEEAAAPKSMSPVRTPPPPIPGPLKSLDEEAEENPKENPEEKKEIEVQSPTDDHQVPKSIDADILGGGEDEIQTITDDSNEQAAADTYFEQVYEQFIDLKKECGESTENLTFKRFSKKLQKNQDALIAKHSCRSVKFQVYEKDGKAALKASPVK